MYLRVASHTHAMPMIHAQGPERRRRDSRVLTGLEVGSAPWAAARAAEVEDPDSGGAVAWGTCSK